MNSKPKSTDQSVSTSQRAKSWPWSQSSQRSKGRRILEFSFGLTAIVAAIVVWKALAILQFVAFFILVEALVRNQPTSIQYRIKANYIRKDGSKSQRRKRAEMRAIQKLRRDLYTVVGIAFVVINVMILVIHDEVIPLSIGLDAITSFSASEQTWKENLRDEEQQFDRWSEMNHKSPEEIETHKRVIWASWPFIVMAFLAVFAACFVFIKAAYVQSLKELSDSIDQRALRYAHLDSQRKRARTRPRSNA